MNRFFVIGFSLLFAVACSKDCNPDDPATWSDTCHSTSSSNGGSSSGGSNTSGGTTTTTTTTTHTPVIGPKLTARATYQSSPSILSVSGSGVLLFSANINTNSTEPSLSGTGASQVFLYKATAVTVVSPNPGSCTLSPNMFGFTGSGTNALQFMTDSTTDCTSLLTQMKLNGFTAKFTNAPANNGETIGEVTYIVKP